MTIPQTMKGVQLVKYGPPIESLKYSESIPVPQIKSTTQVLIQVKAAGLNPIEAKVAFGNVKMATFIMSMPCVIGADFSGVVVAVGDKVTDFKVGDEIFGSQQMPFGMTGSYAQYTVVETTKASIAKKPLNLTHEQAASVGTAGLTAYQGIVNNGKITDKNIDEARTIVVVGASGGVGSYAVQIAKAINCNNTVIGICSGKNASYVMSLGADLVIDYTNAEEYGTFIKSDAKGSIDLVFDCVGGESYYSKLDPLLKKKGIYSTCVGPLEHVGSSNVGVLTAGYLVTKVIQKYLFGAHPYAIVTRLPHKEFRSKIARLIEEKVNATLEEAIPIENAAEAFDKIWSQRTVGKIVLSID